MNQEKPHDKKLVVDNTPYPWEPTTITESQLRTLANLPDNVQIWHKIPGKPDELVLPGSTVDLLVVNGIDRFSSQAAQSCAGKPLPLLTPSDYLRLDSINLVITEVLDSRYLIFTNFPLPPNIYNPAANTTCEILVGIPTNYPDSGIDMFWVHPALTRQDGKPIPQTAVYGGGDPRFVNGKEYCRWSRHWNASSNLWKSGIDSIDTIINRITWALTNPDAE